VADRKLARILKNCRELPGSELFQYIDEDGERHAIGSEDVNDYLREISGCDITAKDFRTWAGTNLAVLEIAGAGPEPPTKKAVVEVVRRVAEQLGNTPAVCRSCYIHPRVLSGWTDGSLRPLIGEIAEGEGEPEHWAVERVVMRCLARWEAEGGETARRGRSGAALKPTLQAALHATQVAAAAMP
jgi:DNA topoisomerase-1